MSGPRTDPAPRQVWWVKIPGVNETKSRPAVVLHVEHDYIEVAYGQRSPGVRRCVACFAADPKNRTLKLTKDTFFREENVVLVARANFESFMARCPLELWLALEQLKQDAYASFRGRRLLHETGQAERVPLPADP